MPDEHTPLLKRIRDRLPATKKSKLDIARCALAFYLEVQVGMIEAALGSLLGSIQDAYGVSYGVVGFISLADAVGRFTGSVSAPFVMQHTGLQWMLYLTSAILAASFVVDLVAPPFAVALVGLSLAGLGSGALKPSLSTYIAHFHEGPLMSVVYAGEGLGALIQPFIVAGMMSAQWGWNLYFVVPLVMAVLNIPLIWLLFHGYEPPEHEEGAEKGSVRRWLGVCTRGVVVYGCMLQALGYSAEDIISTWITVFMSDVRGGKESYMQSILAGYWAGETLGRTLLADATHRFGARMLLTVYLVSGIVVLLVLQFVTSIVGDGVVVALFGFFIGPVIPTVITAVSDSVPNSLVEPANSVLMAAGVIGSGVAPSVVGFINSAGGLKYMPTVLIGVVVVTIVVWQLSFTTMEEKQGKDADDDEEEGDGNQ